MERRVNALLGGLCVLASACSPSGRDATPQPMPSSPAPTFAATVATSTATAAPTAARPPPPAATAILRAAAAVEPAARVPLTPGVEAVVHPAATFEVELSVPASDARVVLVDARDDLVPATGTREVGAGTKLTLAPTAPLVPASRYALRLDGASDRDLHDDAGRAFSAVTLPLLAAGSPPAPEPKRPARRKKRH